MEKWIMGKCCKDELGPKIYDLQLCGGFMALQVPFMNIPDGESPFLMNLN